MSKEIRLPLALVISPSVKTCGFASPLVRGGQEFVLAVSPKTVAVNIVNLIYQVVFYLRKPFAVAFFKGGCGYLGEPHFPVVFPARYHK